VLRNKILRNGNRNRSCCQIRGNSMVVTAYILVISVVYEKFCLDFQVPVLYSKHQYAPLRRRL
jgi:hypothetical protein